MSQRQLIDLVVGTRPNIIKAAPLYKALQASDWAQPRLVFLQQHTDPALSTQTLEDVGLSLQQTRLIPLQGTHYGDRLGCMVARYAQHLSACPPDLVTVFGDVDTTLAAAMAAKREKRPLAHVEAGLRSHDRTMPEELNRLMVDAIADLHLTTTAEARDTLLREGQPAERVHFVGNLMIDSLLQTVDAEFGGQLCAQHAVTPRSFVLATFHRPSNVDSRDGLLALADMLAGITAQLPVLLPLHPRTKVAIEREGLAARFAIDNLQIIPPLRYRHFVNLQANAAIIVSDSGGIQEEAAVLGVPCLTVRDTTERPDTLSAGNELVRPEQAASRLGWLLSQPRSNRHPIALWDGHSAIRIADTLRSHCQPA